MIEEIHIHDLGVITDAVLPLGPGLSILSGETGAGKTMVVTALGMLLGNRADAGAVRSGSSKALAEATVRVPVDHAAVGLVEESGGTVDREEVGGGDEALILISRTVSAEGRSRAHVGGRSAPVGTLAAVGESLVAVHGQSDQLRLKSAGAQRTALDDYAGQPVAAELAVYREELARYRSVVATLRAAKENSRERALQAQSLTTALAEIDAVEPVPGEDTQLDAESEKLTNLESLRTAATTAHAALSGSEADDAPEANAVALLSHAQQALELESDADPDLAALAARVRELTVVAADVAADLSGYASGLDEDGPARLAEVEARRSALRALTKKYGATIDEVLSWADEARTQLDELVVDPQREEQLRAEGEKLHASLEKHAATLLTLRRAAAEKLAAAVSAELTALAMPNASLVVAVEPSERFTDDGRDTVEFMLAPHAQATPRPLGKGASGGELSRIMLALEVVLSEVDPVPTFVFDEVDSGVGGKAAVEIGRRLKMLARNVQVLVVTHLPQVAAFADQHILVTKSSDSSVSDVKVLTEEERVVELARMLAGHEDSDAAREHARELLRDATA
ncbi:DNA repair protein RecN [Kocuria rhizophila]|uniref:DNA repair protein RecN n=1 Tax=Kocuria rhizophila TaxID=72000 RepID=A0AAX2SD61_KOCRH|nr:MULTISPECIES: DNA repair protein RecN [Kocuria]MBO4145872.1 DNA repair protein RecN [Kocuria rhizophila]MCG7425538.1 DNA repair protein RecN [Kocuria rhizophila]MCT1457823.1 DNA repair protein RecN [Kocuria rhizophila]MCT1956748.1 DNA repair protein RecN [Kocuria rhizophila]MCT2072691.1 DNA repair protein RecN [Kocuria rhizophila]